MSSEPLAHSANDIGVPQTLVEHAIGVAQLAAQFAGQFDAEKLGYCLGLLHDIGKACPEWQRYVVGEAIAARGPDHSSAGALAACGAAELLAFPVAGHHGGLPARAELVQRLRAKASDSRICAAVERAASLTPPLTAAQCGEVRLPDSLSRGTSPELATEFFVRMLYSALVDADFLDTEQHLDRERAQARPVSPPLEDYWRTLVEAQERFARRPRTSVNLLRDEVYQASVSAAGQSPGFFSLSVPTGAGKTRSSLAFAIAHALEHGLERVVVAVPYTSIIEQTVADYRSVFGVDAVLEHHSAVDLRDDAAGLRQRLATENWDARLVVTTTVQLFESLFANRVSACRKLHNLARSVIVLDEIQTLPTALMLPIVSALRELVANYHASVLLCTATQPALDAAQLDGGIDGVRDVVPESKRLFTQSRRVDYELPHVLGTWSWERVAEEMRSASQSLCVVNTKADALALLDALDDKAALHLSTLLCGAHRLDVVREVAARLAEGAPCRLVATQVVECGVDLDFPLVLRAVGPLDRIVQAAGRCNREGRMRSGRVVVFEPSDGHLPPGEYRSATDTTKSLLRDLGSAALETPDTFPAYFRRLYDAVDCDAKGIQPLRKALDYPEVASRFRIIADESALVLVHYRSPKVGHCEVDELIARLRAPGALSRHVLRRAQPFCVSVRRHEYERGIQEGLVKEIIPAALGEWLGLYGSPRGIDMLGANPAAFVI